MSSELSLLPIAVGSVRFAAVFAIAPVFGHRAVPARVRIAMGVLVAAGLGALSPAGVADAATDALPRIVLVEASVGAILGFATRLLFAGIGLFGEVISIQGGLGAAAAIDPASEASSLALASLLQVFAFLIYLAIDGHHLLIQTLALSLERLPVGAPFPDVVVFAELARMGGVIFELALRLAAPMMAAMLLANLVVGILGRVIPQLNLMTVQLPALIALTLVLLLMSAPLIVEILGRDLTAWAARVDGLLPGGP